MTTAPTPSRADALIREHRACMHPETLRAWASDAVDELGRLQADNEHLQGSLEAQRLISDRAIALAKELEASKNASIHKLEMDALDLASENSILKRQEQAELEARKPLPLSDEQLRAEFTPWAEIQYRHEDEFSKRDFKICLAAWSAGRRITGGSS
ncbi:hypothetical protein GY15_32360 [Delftia sp. 670]|nr:hypothetical protein GY15_32360 [Delftia sp. 670]